MTTSRQSLKGRGIESIHHPLASATTASVVSPRTAMRRREPDRRWRAPSRIDEVVLHWSRKDVGMGAAGMSGAWIALHRLTGGIPIVHTSSTSVAAWRLREGEITGVSVTRRGAKAWALRRMILSHIPSEQRGSLGRQRDQSNRRFTLAIRKPRTRPALEPHYELLRTRTSVPGFSVTVARSGQGRELTGSQRRWRVEDRGHRHGMASMAKDSAGMSPGIDT